MSASRVIATIGRARLGRQVSNPTSSRSANRPPPFGAERNTGGVAVDAKYIYWANADTGLIARAKLNGSGPPTRQRGFIRGASSPRGWRSMPSYIYWANFPPPHRLDRRADIDGNPKRQPEPHRVWAKSHRHWARRRRGALRLRRRGGDDRRHGRVRQAERADGDDVIAARGGDETVAARNGDDLVWAPGAPT